MDFILITDYPPILGGWVNDKIQNVYINIENKNLPPPPPPPLVLAPFEGGGGGGGGGIAWHAHILVHAELVSVDNNFKALLYSFDNDSSDKCFICMQKCWNCLPHFQLLTILPLIRSHFKHHGFHIRLGSFNGFFSCTQQCVEWPPKQCVQTVNFLEDVLLSLVWWRNMWTFSFSPLL